MAEAAVEALDTFATSDWGRKFPTVAAMWRRQWKQVTPFFAYPPAVRKIIYTTNAIESMHMQLRNIVKNRGHFPSNDAASKLLYLSIISQWAAIFFRSRALARTGQQPHTCRDHCA